MIEIKTQEEFLRGLPKTELHMHLEGSLEPETLFMLARRNGVALRWDTPEALRAAYAFRDLPDFLALYFEACAVLCMERDFHDATAAYLRRAREDGVLHAEIFFGPQSFTDRGIPVAAMMDGILGAIEAAEDETFSAGLLVSVHRHRSEDAAFEVLRAILPWRDRILGIGMGGAEIGNPPDKFARFFRAAQEAGFPTMVHAGEEGPPAYVRQALDLGVQRIDHGVAAAADPALMADLAAQGVPLTVCPLSNLRLNVVASLADHPLATLLRAGVRVTVNADDPPYFGGWVTENLLACADAMDLSRDEVIQIVRNGFDAAFVSEARRADLHARLTAYLAG
ncbi:MAG: adenosine deaminase [Rhodospirillales bacterium]|nr:adenosine deaminase [Rhodospirillales bacterium]